MNSTCLTCAANLPLANEGKYAGNCQTCVQICQRQDIAQERKQQIASANGWITVGFMTLFALNLVFDFFKDSPNSLTAVIADGFGADRNLVAIVISLATLVISSPPFFYAAKRFMNLPQVSDSL